MIYCVINVPGCLRASRSRMYIQLRQSQVYLIAISLMILTYKNIKLNFFIYIAILGVREILMFSTFHNKNIFNRIRIIARH